MTPLALFIVHFSFIHKRHKVTRLGPHPQGDRAGWGEVGAMQIVHSLLRQAGTLHSTRDRTHDRTVHTTVHMTVHTTVRGIRQGAWCMAHLLCDNPFCFLQRRTLRLLYRRTRPNWRLGGAEGRSCCAKWRSPIASRPRPRAACSTGPISMCTHRENQNTSEIITKTHLMSRGTCMHIPDQLAALFGTPKLMQICAFSPPFHAV